MWRRFHWKHYQDMLQTRIESVRQRLPSQTGYLAELFLRARESWRRAKILKRLLPIMYAAYPAWQALWAKRGESGFCAKHETRRGEKNVPAFTALLFLLPSCRSPCSSLASHKKLRLPRLAHKAPVMQAVPGLARSPGHCLLRWHSLHSMCHWGKNEAGNMVLNE